MPNLEMNKIKWALSIYAIIAWLICTAPCPGEDWPAYQHDNRRSGISREKLNMPCRPAWTYQGRHAPQPAWPAPAKADFWHEMTSLNPLVTYDRTFETVIAGPYLYFASSADGKVYCLEVENGTEKWSYYTQAPVRLAPAVYGEKLLFGSDDGQVYCLDRVNGRLLWKVTLPESQQYVMGNERMISSVPCRSGVLVYDGIAYFTLGLFPTEKVYLCAVDADNGSMLWSNAKTGISPQGYLLASASRLYVPTGRTSPAIFDRHSGDWLGTLETPRAEGGTWAMLAEESVLSGPGTVLRWFKNGTTDVFASFAGRRMIVENQIAYLLTDTELSAIDRSLIEPAMKRRQELNKEFSEIKKKINGMRRRRDTEISGHERWNREIETAAQQLVDVETQLQANEKRYVLWRSPCAKGEALIMAGDLVLVGADGRVAAYRIKDGALIWSDNVNGIANGLAVANGRLFASTHSGAITCFQPTAMAGKRVHVPTVTAANPPPDSYSKIASAIIKNTGIRKGVCLVLGSEQGHLAMRLAEQTDLYVVGIEDDSAKAACARAVLDRRGLYGTRATIITGSQQKLPFSAYVFNLIVSDEWICSETMSTPAQEVARVLRPFGGRFCIGGNGTLAKSNDDLEKVLTWAAHNHEFTIHSADKHWMVMEREALAGAGEWISMYGNLGNTAASQDQLVGSDLKIQWYGRPGPHMMNDRHHRATAPLVKNGRMFIPADDRIYAVDAYNGTELWQMPLSNTRHLAAPREAGYMVIDDSRLFVARDDSCLVIDPDQGRRVSTFLLPQGIDKNYHWGYLAPAGPRLIGSGRKKEAIYREMSKVDDAEIQWGDFKRMTTSTFLFALDQNSKKPLWTYQQGIVINPAIAIGEGKIFFVASRNPAAVMDKDGLIALDVLLEKNSTFLVALDLASGNTVWERPVDFSLGHILYLSYAEGRLLVSGSTNREGRAWYNLYAFDAASGRPTWTADHPNNKKGIGGDHGEQIHHPVIVNGLAYCEPCIYRLQTGERVNPRGEPENWTMEERGGCGTLSGSPSCLFFRDDHPALFDLALGRTRKINTVSRPGCWINIIAAGGLVLIPEASSGCTCSYSLQTSLAYLPVAASVN